MKKYIITINTRVYETTEYETAWEFRKHFDGYLACIPFKGEHIRGLKLKGY